MKNHFYNESQKGRSDDEIIASLGNLDGIISAFNTNENKSQKIKGLTLIIISQFFWLPCFLMMMLFTIVLLAASLSSGLIGIYYLFQLDFLSFMPVIPLPISLLYAFTFLFGVYFFYQLSRLYWLSITYANHYVMALQKTNTLKVKHASGYKINEKIIKQTRIATIIYFVMIATLLIVSMVVTKNVQFWHEWSWFS